MQELDPPPNGDLTRLERSAPPTKIDETAASLESLLQAERNHRNQERFFWIFGCSLLLDIIIFRELGAWGFPIFLLQIVFLFGLAGWMGVETVTVFLERLFYRYLPGGNRSNSDT
jgi:hypothetical protein